MNGLEPRHTLHQGFKGTLKINGGSIGVVYRSARQTLKKIGRTAVSITTSEHANAMGRLVLALHAVRGSLNLVFPGGFTCVLERSKRATTTTTISHPPALPKFYFPFHNVLLEYSTSPRDGPTPHVPSNHEPFSVAWIV